MKRILTAVMLLAMSVAVAGAQEKAKAAPKAGGGVSQTITNLENQWTKASKAKDAAGVGALLADNIVIVDSDGTSYDKAETVKRIQKSNWQTNAVSDLKVTVHGDTAVATGVWTGKGDPGTGKAIDTKERFADTWVKGPDGKWLCVASASATMKK